VIFFAKQKGSVSVTAACYLDTWGLGLPTIRNYPQVLVIDCQVLCCWIKLEWWHRRGLATVSSDVSTDTPPAQAESPLQ
jgi:hypothetical protein